MKLTPKTETEIAEAGILPEGVYDFEVKQADEQVSKAGNDMIKLTIHVFDNQGSPRTVFDYLLDAFPMKLRNLCVALDVLDSYDSGALDADDLIGKSAKVVLGKQEAKDGYPAKNVVKDYKPVDVASAPARKPLGRKPVMATADTSDIDDEIPF